MAAALAVARRGGGPVALQRVAASVEERRRLRRQSSAGFAEVRATSLLVPVLAAVVIGMLLAGQPNAAATVLSPLGLLILGLCAAVCAAGVLLIRRLTAPSGPER